MSRPAINFSKPRQSEVAHYVAALFVGGAVLLSSPAVFAATKAKAAAPAAADCNWDNPGVGGLMGMIPPTIANFADIPAASKARLMRKMDRHVFDDFVTITRDSIKGKHRYESQIGQMQFADGKVCSKVKRTNWKPTQLTRALVYCDDGVCILVPVELRNVARVTRLSDTRMADVTPEQMPPDVLDQPLPPTAAGPVDGSGGSIPGSISPPPAAPAFELLATAGSLPGLQPGTPGVPLFGASSSGGGSTGGNTEGGGSSGGGTSGGGTSGGGTTGGGTTGGGTTTGGGGTGTDTGGGTTGGGGTGTGGGTTGGGDTGGTGGTTGGGDTGGGTTTPPVPPVTVVPEPGMMALWAAGLALVGISRRRRSPGA